MREIQYATSILCKSLRYTVRCPVAQHAMGEMTRSTYSRLWMDDRNFRVTEDPGVCMENSCSGLQLSAQFRAMGSASLFMSMLCTDAFIICVGGRWWARGHLHPMVPSEPHNDGCPFSRLLRCGVGPPGLKNLRFAMTIQIRHPPVFDGRLGFGHPPPFPSPGDCQIKQSLLPFLETVQYNSPKPSSCRKKVRGKKNTPWTEPTTIRMQWMHRWSW